MSVDKNLFKKSAQVVTEQLSNYLNDSKKGRLQTLKQNTPQKIAADLKLELLLRNGALLNDDFPNFLKKYLENTQHLHHPHYLGHQVSAPNMASGFADYIHGTINNPMAVYEMGPAAATMEKIVVNWMLEKIGWFKTSSLIETNLELCKGAGILTHGGSLANLTALLAARAHCAPESWTQGTPQNLVVLAPKNAHYSVAKSLAIMGIGYDSIVSIDTDKNEVIIPSDLKSAYTKTKKQNKRILAVVANACATGTGLYDPLEEIATFCNSHNLWLHIDAAHGASALLSEEKKHLLKGVHLADSLVWDAHKMLQTSALSAAVLFKNHSHLENTFKQKGDYLFFEKENIGFDLMDKTIECTKAPLGTKVFMAIAYKGEKGLAKNIEETYNKTLAFHKLISVNHNFECPYKPESNILCFRYMPFANNDTSQLKLRNALVKKGHFYITTTTIKAKRYLRIAVMNKQTESVHIKNLLKEIETIAKNLT
jgi:L-2,4-diaminobutyrate decarboxylase